MSKALKPGVANHYKQQRSVRKNRLKRGKVAEEMRRQSKKWAPVIDEYGGK